jgi:hypothetical protein
VFLTVCQGPRLARHGLFRRRFYAVAAMLHDVVPRLIGGPDEVLGQIGGGTPVKCTALEVGIVRAGQHDNRDAAGCRSGLYSRTENGPSFTSSVFSIASSSLASVGSQAPAGASARKAASPGWRASALTEVATSGALPGARLVSKASVAMSRASETLLVQDCNNAYHQSHIYRQCRE